MTAIATYERVKLDKLKNHRLNAKVFGELKTDGDCDDFSQSVKDHGVLQPLIVTADFTIIAGHRRRQAAAKAGLKEVPCVVRRDLKDQKEIDRFWFETNRNREMTTEQKARWFKALKEIESEKARERQKTKSQLPVNLPEAGEAAEIAAKEVGLSRKTAESAAKVVDAIDEAEAAGDHETAEELRSTLNKKSVRAAQQAVQEKSAGKSSGASIVRDALEREIPEELREHHSRAAQFKAMGTKIDAIRREVENLAVIKGGEHLDAANVIDCLREVKDEIMSARYWTECPRCTSEPNHSCTLCGGHRFVPHKNSGKLSDDDRKLLGMKS